MAAIRWVPAADHLRISGTVSLRRWVTCCGCGVRVEHDRAWAAVSVSGPSYLFCHRCSRSDPSFEWERAHRLMR